jgi:hypothetical protein
VTLAAGVLAGATAFALSVPGIDRSTSRRALPFVTALVWAGLLAVLLANGGQPAQRLMAFPVNWPCGYKILGFSVIFGGAILVLLRRAAPLDFVWTGSLAALAATAMAAAATQLVCPVDDPAHQLVGHVVPVIVLAAAGTAIGVRALNWLRPAGR